MPSLRPPVAHALALWDGKGGWGTNPWRTSQEQKARTERAYAEMVATERMFLVKTDGTVCRFVNQAHNIS